MDLQHKQMVFSEKAQRLKNSLYKRKSSITLAAVAAKEEAAEDSTEEDDLFIRGTHEFTQSHRQSHSNQTNFQQQIDALKNELTRLENEFFAQNDEESDHDVKHPNTLQTTPKAYPALPQRKFFHRSLQDSECKSPTIRLPEDAEEKKNQAHAASRHAIGSQESPPSVAKKSVERVPQAYSSPSPFHQATSALHAPQNAQESNVTFWEFATSDIGLDVEYSASSFRNGPQKRQRSYFSIEMVRNLEIVQALGIAVCLDTLLYVFTVLPLRIVIAFWKLLQESYWRMRRWTLHKSDKNINHTVYNGFHRMHAYDIARGLILIISPYALYKIAGDISWLYHVIRTQEFMKLYVIFNMLDIFDRLVTVFGQESFEQLYRTICYYDTKPWGKLVRCLFQAELLALLYVVMHSLVSFVQIVTLNVAMSSKVSSVMLLLISSNFVEVKGLVFKRFDESNLFQITCSDITERFFLYLSLFCVFVQNADFTDAQAWDGLFSWHSVEKIFEFQWFSFDAIYSHFWANPAYAVILGEVIVDLVKHSFILKFNNIPAKVYQKFATIIAEDATTHRIGSIGKNSVGNTTENAESTVDPTHAVVQRLGLPAFAYAAVVIRVGMRVVRQVEDAGLLSNTLPQVAMAALLLLCLCCIKLLVSMMVARQARVVQRTLQRRYVAENQERLFHHQFSDAKSTTAEMNKTTPGQQFDHRNQTRHRVNVKAKKSSVRIQRAQAGLIHQTPAGKKLKRRLSKSPAPSKKHLSTSEIHTPSESLDNLRNIKRFELHGKRVV